MRLPAGTVTPSMSAPPRQPRAQIEIGVSIRRPSLKAEGISAGSSRRIFHCSGSRASIHTVEPIPLMVVSKAGPM